MGARKVKIGVESNTWVLIFSVNPPPSGGLIWLNVTPQVESQTGFLSDENEWMYIDGCFYADGEKPMSLLAIFKMMPALQRTLCAPGNSSASYYYVDDVFATGHTTAFSDHL
jgi:hypothetical protein